MKSAEEWQEELAGETSLESIRQIQSDARRSAFEEAAEITNDYTADMTKAIAHIKTDASFEAMWYVKSRNDAAKTLLKTAETIPMTDDRHEIRK